MQAVATVVLQAEAPVEQATQVLAVTPAVEEVTVMNPWVTQAALQAAVALTAHCTQVVPEV